VALTQLPVREEAESLVTVFFTFLESNWYYFDERWLRDLLDGLYDEKAHAQEQQEGATVCLIFLVLALASSFRHLTKPVGSLPSRVNTPEAPGREYFVQVRKLIPAAIAANSVESVICCLLTALYVLPTEDLSHHHTYLGLALNIAVGLSLHRKGIDTKMPPRVWETTNRLFWTVYCLER
jgi:hypothetical protein